MRQAGWFVLVWSCAAAPAASQTGPLAGSSASAASASAPSEANASTERLASENTADPAPHWHDYPDLHADDLSEPTGSGSAPRECELPKPPALAHELHELHERVLSGPPITNRIPPELIMAPIRKRAACFQGCYRDALGRKPNLAGKLSVWFVVDLDGWVRKARLNGSELDDRELETCVTRSFIGLEYPEPEGGRVTVVYPLVFGPP